MLSGLGVRRGPRPERRTTGPSWSPLGALPARHRDVQRANRVVTNAGPAAGSWVGGRGVNVASLAQSSKVGDLGAHPAVFARRPTRTGRAWHGTYCRRRVVTVYGRMFLPPAALLRFNQDAECPFPCQAHGG